MIGRLRFVTLSGSAILGALASGTAHATGGLDPDLGTPPPLLGAPPDAANPTIRVLLATGFDAQQLPTEESGATFSYDGKTYRGTSSIVDGPDRRPALIASLPIDAYLYGVVPLEIGRGWPSRALAAQAIVARTYALTHRVTGRQYDLVASSADQVWGGVSAETADTNAAVDSTEGDVVTFLGGLASVFYSACCGGHTADASRVWGGVELPYLRGVADPYCMLTSPYAAWTVSLTVGALVAALGARARAAGELTSIALGDPAQDGRRGLRLVGKRGIADFTSAQIRSALGPRTLRSGLLRTLTLEGDPAQAATYLRIEGSGLGHGVGLCQWGARVMAQQGRSAREIVGFYFPGTIVTNV